MTASPTLLPLGVHYDLADGDYYTAAGLSQSGAKVLLDTCPKLFRWNQDHPDTDRKYDEGHVIHSLAEPEELGRRRRPLPEPIREERAMTTDVLTPALITKAGVYEMTAEDYHRDPVPGGSLSSTGARKLIQEAGPAKFKWDRDHPGEFTSDAFDFGTAAHQLVLGDSENRVVIINAKDWRTKAAQAEQAEAREAGKTPVLAKQWAVVEEMAAAILTHPTAAALLQTASGKPEQSLFWQDPVSGIWCRSRIDWFRAPVGGKRLIVVDYKTCASAARDEFSRSAANYGYHQQDDWYRAGVRVLGVDPDPAFLFVAQEKTAPYLVNVIELDETAQNIGRNLNRIAINTYAECTRTGIWPGFTGISLVSLPVWYERDHDEK